MKIKILLLATMLSLSLLSVNLTGCSAGAHIGPVGAGVNVR